MRRVVTIDGPAGAGKSTVARQLAVRLGWRFLDTGAMYRAITLAALNSGTDLTSDEELGKLAASLEVELLPDAVRLDGQDVTQAIRRLEVTQASRYIADSPSVRRELMDWQRDFARDRDIVTEGRDQGTLVFPDAFRKYFLTASDEERARRRWADYQARGESVSFESVLQDQRQRDARDAVRAIAPMKPAADATIIDTTGLSIDDVVERLAADIEDRLTN
jgi:CMP/dCMP kinase